MSDLGWFELYFDGLVGDDPGYAEVEWAIKEIERLQDKIRDYESACTMKQEIIDGDKERVKEINKLTGRIERLRGYNDLLRARVKELERERNDALKQNLRDLKYVNGHYITDEQIDAAVAIANTGAQLVGLAWKALNKLNIFRCKKCGGSGRRYEGDSRGGEIEFHCGGCNGKGYTIGGAASGDV
jgi:hypothetical protein